jgi:hypothetical protein
VKKRLSAYASAGPVFLFFFRRTGLVDGSDEGQEQGLSQASGRRMLWPTPTRTALIASPLAPARRFLSRRPSVLEWPMIGSTRLFGEARA